jgi:hypothetical protein
MLSFYFPSAENTQNKSPAKVKEKLVPIKVSVFFIQLVRRARNPTKVKIRVATSS